MYEKLIQKQGCIDKIKVQLLHVWKTHSEAYEGHHFSHFLTAWSLCIFQFLLLWNLVHQK